MKHSRYKYISIIVVLTIILTFKTVNSRRLLSRRSRRKASEILGISVFTVNVRRAQLILRLLQKARKMRLLAGCLQHFLAGEH